MTFTSLNWGRDTSFLQSTGTIWFVSNKHAVYAAIKEALPEGYIEEAAQQREEAKIRFKEVKEKNLENFRQSIEQLPEDKRENFSVKQWKSDFEYFNSHLAKEDLDEEDFVIPHSTEQSNKAKDLYKSKLPIKICLVGRENVGKSSIINSVLKEDRTIVSDIPGTTRDSVPVQWAYKGRKVVLTDTAGIKNTEKSKIEQIIEKNTMNVIKMSNVVVYVCEAQEGVTPLDWKMINFIGEEGRGCVVVMNKWDLVDNEFKVKAKKYLNERLKKSHLKFNFKRIIFSSAKHNDKLDRIMDDVLQTFSNWNSRLSTGILNDWSTKIKKTTKNPGRGGDHLRLKFVTQVKMRPPQFIAFVNDRNLFFRAHETFLRTALAEEFKLTNIPIRVMMRDYDNTRIFKKQSVAGSKIKKKVEMQKERMKRPTAWRKEKGYAKLYGKDNVYYKQRKGKVEI